MTPLVQKLLVGQHPISLIRYRNIGDVKDAAERGLVLVKLTDTQGGTELGVQLENSTDNIVMTAGEITLSGFLTLDYQQLACTIRINPVTLKGYGSLERLDS
jgi:hypothetical protein